MSAGSPSNSRITPSTQGPLHWSRQAAEVEAESEEDGEEQGEGEGEEEEGIADGTSCCKEHCSTPQLSQGGQHSTAGTRLYMSYLSHAPRLARVSEVPQCA